MKTILIVNEKFGRFSGAEQNLIVTIPYISKKFKIHFLYEENTNKGLELLSPHIEAEKQMGFTQEDSVKKSETSSYLNEIKPDIIYVHKCGNLVMLKEFRNLGIPVIRMQHDHDMYCMRSYRYNPLTRKICTKKAGLGCIFPCMASLKRDRSGKGFMGLSWVSYSRHMQQLKVNLTFDKVFAVTTFMRDELLNQGFTNEQIEIFPPVPLEKDVEESNFSKKNIIIFATQIIRGKGLDCLIKAIAKVKTDCQLLIFGEGSHKEYCEELTQEMKLEDKVKFMGFVSQEVLTESYRDATMGTVPSVWPEPIATVGLEFLRHGLPVVGFDAGGIKDWLIDGETGYLINWMDIDSMAEKIDYLLQNKDKAAELGRKGKEFVNDKYNFANYIERLVGHLSELAEKTSN